jgi:methylmalonyl-CoA mutase
MKQSDETLDGFQGMTAEDWWEVIRKELKGQPVDALNWQIEGQLMGRPFYHSSDQAFDSSMTQGRESADWHIAEWLQDHSSGSNKDIIEALEGGAQALCLPMTGAAELPGLLNGVLTDVAPVYWSPVAGISATQFFQDLKGYLDNRPSESGPSSLIGGCLETLDDEMLKQMWGAFPDWRALVVQGREVNQGETHLGGMVEEARNYLDGVSWDKVKAGQWISIIDIGTDFILEIARIRAWRLLWSHLMAGYGLDPSTPHHIFARVPTNPDISWESNFISATTRGLSAVLGGIDTLSIQPPAHESSRFTARIARNIQHLLKEEAHLKYVMDPLGGSFSIEQLTQQLAEDAWSKLPA